MIEKFIKVLRKYPQFTAFLREFYDEDPPDEKIAEKVMCSSSPKMLLETIIEAENILLIHDFPWKEIVEVSNRYHEKEDEVRIWVQNLLDCIKKIEPRTIKYFYLEMKKICLKQLHDQYPTLSEFFVQEYEDQYVQQTSDEDKAKKYALNLSKDKRIRLIAETKLFVEDKSIPWDEINENAKGAFKERQDFKVWMSDLIANFEGLSE